MATGHVLWGEPDFVESPFLVTKSDSPYVENATCDTHQINSADIPGLQAKFILPPRHVVE